ncbi:MAG: peptidylprolyl isomerase [Dehalococcoidia bacterium]
MFTRFASLAALLLAFALVLGACTDDKKDGSSSDQYGDNTPSATEPGGETPQATTGGITPVGSFSEECQKSDEKQFAAAPPQIIDTSKSYIATIKTSKGDIVAELETDPVVTTNNLVFLACKGYYDGLTFHRVEDWVIQGGDPTGTGSGGPGYTIQGEFEGAVFDEGVIGMARTSDPNSAGSQFFIVKTAANYLDGQYAAFGKVTSGMDVVNQIAIGDTIDSVTIEES